MKSIYKSPIGELTLYTSDHCLEGLYTEKNRFPLPTDIYGDSNEAANVMKLSFEWLDSYFANERPSPSDIKLGVEKTEFRMKVREIMLKIPFGETMTYGEIAEMLSDGRKMSAQAVGGAVGHNSVSIIVPCHRVIGCGGKLVGYGGGLNTKKKLLDFESGIIKFG